MTTTPDISSFSPPQLIALKAAIDERLEDIRQRHIEEAETLGLTLVQTNGSTKRKRRSKPAEQETK